MKGQTTLFFFIWTFIPTPFVKCLESFVPQFWLDNNHYTIIAMMTILFFFFRLLLPLLTLPFVMISLFSFVQQCIAMLTSLSIFSIDVTWRMF